MAQKTITEAMNTEITELSILMGVDGYTAMFIDAMCDRLTRYAGTLEHEEREEFDAVLNDVFRLGQTGKNITSLLAQNNKLNCIKK